MSQRPSGRRVPSSPLRPPRTDIGHEPDYRFSLANERTFLAWIRTALALDAAGLAVVGLFPDLPVRWAKEGIGLVLVGLGTVVAVASVRRWARNEEAMRTDAPLPSSRVPYVLALVVAVLSVVAVVLLVATRLGA